MNLKPQGENLFISYLQKHIDKILGNWNAKLEQHPEMRYPQQKCLHNFLFKVLPWLFWHCGQFVDFLFWLHFFFFVIP